MVEGLSFIWLMVLVALTLWCLVLTLVILKLRTFLKLFTTGISRKDLKSLLELINNKLDNQQDKLTDLTKNLDSTRVKQKAHLQNSALIRYNPFGDTGGNQSFALSLLDAEGNGFVVTSLHSREHTRLYAKEVRQGSRDKAEYSKEEQEAIATALKKGSR